MKTLNIFKCITIYFSFLMLCCCSSTKSPLREAEQSKVYEKHLITYEQAKVLEQRYIETNYKAINASRKENSPDSRLYWYSIQELESYLQYVKREAKANGYEGVGIRIYMGKYPDENDGFDKRLKKEYYGYQTTFLVPTYKKKMGANEDHKRMDGSEDHNILNIPPMNFNGMRPPPPIQD